MSKYEIIKNGMDDYTLKYKDKTINFNGKVDYAIESQNIVKTARMRMITDLAKEGKSIKSLVIEEKKDGKTLYDNSNKEYIEETYINEVQEEIFNDILKKMLGYTFEELVLEIGLEDTSDIIKLGEDIGKVIAGNYTPSGEKENK